MWVYCVCVCRRVKGRLEACLIFCSLGTLVLRQNPSLVWNSSISLSWMARNHQGMCCFCLPGPGVKRVLHFAQLFWNSSSHAHKVHTWLPSPQPYFQFLDYVPVLGRRKNINTQFFFEMQVSQCTKLTSHIELSEWVTLAVILVLASLDHS